MWGEDPLNSRQISIKQIKLIYCTDLRNLPDSLQSSLRTFRRLVEKLTWHFCAGFVENVRDNHEGHHNVFPFTHKARRKNTERPEVAWRIRLIYKSMATNDNSYPKQELWRAQSERCSSVTCFRGNALQVKGCLPMCAQIFLWLRQS